MSDTDLENIKLPSWLYDEIERRVVDLYLELNIHNIPIDPIRIIKAKGYVLKPYSSVGSAKRNELLRIDVEGLSFFDPDIQTFVIYYNNQLCIHRQRFTLMHEMGHIIMGHKEESNLAKKIADAFAAYALAPSPIIWRNDFEDYITLSEICVISPECADYCFQRYNNWLEFGGKLKGYEQKLLNLFDV